MKCGLLDYGTGNNQSVKNALEHIGHSVLRSPQFEDLLTTDVIVFPGQGAFGPAVKKLTQLQALAPLTNYVQSKRPFIGICLGFQLLFDGSEEATQEKGLGCFKGTFKQFSRDRLSVPHMGWNHIETHDSGSILDAFNNQLFYFVHSYYLPFDPGSKGSKTTYGVSFQSAMANNTQLITQFHPEKSGDIGLDLLKAYFKSIS